MERICHTEIPFLSLLYQWDPEDVNLERNKDNVEFVSSRMHRGSLTPADLTSDD